MTPEKLKLLYDEMQRLEDNHMRTIDVSRLLLECVTRIAKGKCPDPRQDACDTLRGAGMLAQEGLRS